jgi:integrase
MNEIYPRVRRSISPKVFELLKKRRQSHPDDYWVFPSPRKPGTHLGSVRKAHDNVCEKMGLRGAIDLYNLRQHADFPIMPTLTH